MRRLALLIVVLTTLTALAACRRSVPDAPRASVAIRELPSHRDATALWGGGDLLVSVARDWERPSPVRLSRGPGAVEHTLTGWPAGVIDERAVVLVPVDDGVDVLGVGLDGRSESLGRLPEPDDYVTPLATIAGGVVAAYVGGTDVHLLDGDGDGARVLSVVDPSEALITLVGNPNGDEMLAVVSYTRGEPRPGPRQRLVLVDTRTGVVRWEAPIGSLPANEGEAAFVAGGRVLVHYDGGFAFHDVATGAATPLWADTYVNARSMAFAGDARRIAYTVRVGAGHMALSDPGCLVYVRDNAARDDMVSSFDGDCYFGRGLLFVGDELWVAPP